MAAGGDSAHIDISLNELLSNVYVDAMRMLFYAKHFGIQFGARTPSYLLCLAGSLGSVDFFCGFAVFFGFLVRDFTNYSDSQS